jgi:Domain of unknown function (DUF4282)
LTVEAEETPMSIPPDDPAHRPPPPRQGEPPYPGGYPPPPPTGHWQGQGGGYGPPPPGHQRRKGVLGHLFDFTFDYMVTPYLIRAAYVFAVGFITMMSAFWLIVGFWLFQYGWLLTVVIVLVTPPLWLLSLVGVRMFLEFLMNQFKITEHLKAMRER